MGVLTAAVTDLRPSSWPRGTPPSPQSRCAVAVYEPEGLQDCDALRAKLQWLNADTIAAQAAATRRSYEDAKANGEWWCHCFVISSTTCPVQCPILSAITVLLRLTADSIRYCRVTSTVACELRHHHRLHHATRRQTRRPMTMMVGKWGS